MPRASDAELKRAFGLVLRSKRRSLGISQEELAHRADVSRNYVGLLEQGRRAPAIGVLFALAEALAESPGDLVAAVESTAGTSAGRLLPKERAEPFKRHLPVYSIEAAAGQYLQNRPAEELGWIPAPSGLRLAEDMFVIRIRGRSMEPLIPDGAVCAFRAGVAGDREGRVLLVELSGQADPEGGGAHTVKRWHSEHEPAPNAEGGWRHRRIELRSINRRFPSIEVSSDDGVRVIAEFVGVL